jgi:hypothetical protein
VNFEHKNDVLESCIVNINYYIIYYNYIIVYMYFFTKYHGLSGKNETAVKAACQENLACHFRHACHRFVSPRLGGLVKTHDISQHDE